MYHLVNGHAEVFGKAFQFINSNITCVVLYLIIAGIGNVYFGGQLLLQQFFPFPDLLNVIA